MVKRRIEVFTAGCPVCRDAVALVRDLACGCYEVIIYDLNKGCPTGACRDKAKEYGIVRLPAVAVDGKLVGCCSEQQPVTRDALIAAGIGQG
ncbi:MAG: glutaredoxin [Bacillota bacterium]